MFKNVSLLAGFMNLASTDMILAFGDTNFRDMIFLTHQYYTLYDNILYYCQDSPLTNAGVGSNLTLDGTVEGDASIMEGNTLQYAAVGAIPGIVQFCKQIAE